MKYFIPLFSLFVLCQAPAFAEKADAQKPTRIEADEMVYDNIRQVKTFIGNVVLTRGTLLIKASKVILATDASGKEHATLYGSRHKRASLRQKRDGGPDLWVEGEAQRIEYSDKTEIADLFTNAQMRRLQGTRVTDEVHGEFISYDSRKEYYTVKNSANGQATPGGRVTAILQPRTDDTKEN